MKPGRWLSLGLIAVGVLILLVQSVQHVQALRHGELKPFEEDGKPILRTDVDPNDKTVMFHPAPPFNPQLLLPTFGTLCVAGGLFWFVLSSGRRPEV